MRCDEKGISLRLSLLSFILLTCCQYRSRRARIFTVFVGSCPVSTVLASRTVHTKREIDNHKGGVKQKRRGGETKRGVRGETKEERV